jgi:PIN domain nuclease of toxin-antitoxin system
VRLLLDSHVLLWWLFDEPLAADTRRAIESASNDLVVSAATIWEIEIKRAAERLTAPDDLVDSVAGAGCRLLPILPEEAADAARLPRHHGDPFDRMLVAQARAHGLTLVSRDERLRVYGVAVLPA